VLSEQYVWFTEDGHINFVDDTAIVNSMINQVEELVVNGWYAAAACATYLCRICVFITADINMCCSITAVVA
jgi:hypothetical protein